MRREGPQPAALTKVGTIGPETGNRNISGEARARTRAPGAEGMVRPLGVSTDVRSVVAWVTSPVPSRRSACARVRLVLRYTSRHRSIPGERQLPTVSAMAGTICVPESGGQCFDSPVRDLRVRQQSRTPGRLLAAGRARRRSDAVHPDPSSLFVTDADIHRSAPVRISKRQ